MFLVVEKKAIKKNKAEKKEKKSSQGLKPVRTVKSIDFSTFAVLATGSKQYYVAPGSVIEIEKLPGDVKDKVIFDQVVLIGTPEEVKVGQPFVKGAVVEAEVLRQFRDDKVIVFKFKNKTGYKKKLGHRQPQTAVRILSIRDKE